MKIQHHIEHISNFFIIKRFITIDKNMSVKRIEREALGSLATPR